MAQQSRQSHRSFWDREPADVVNMPAVYNQDSDINAPVQFQPQTEPQSVRAIDDTYRGKKETAYVQKQPAARKIHEDDGASGCCVCCIM